VVTDRSELARTISAALAATSSADLPALIGVLAQAHAEAHAVLLSAVAQGHGSRSQFRTLSPETVATRLEVPLTQVYSLIREGKLPSLKLGKYVRVPEAALEAQLTAQVDFERRGTHLPFSRPVRHIEAVAGRPQKTRARRATYPPGGTNGGCAAPEVEPTRQTLNG
jgi:excisionase family DNA binding protein